MVPRDALAAVKSLVTVSREIRSIWAQRFLSLIQETKCDHEAISLSLSHSDRAFACRAVSAKSRRTTADNPAVYGRILDNVSQTAPCRVAHARARARARAMKTRATSRLKPGTQGGHISRGHLAITTLRSGTFLLFYPNSSLSRRHTLR